LLQIVAFGGGVQPWTRAPLMRKPEQRRHGALRSFHHPHKTAVRRLNWNQMTQYRLKSSSAIPDRAAQNRSPHCADAATAHTRLTMPKRLRPGVKPFYFHLFETADTSFDGMGCIPTRGSQP